MNLAGSSEKGVYNDGTLDNFGTIIQTGGNLDLHSDNVAPTTFKNEAGAWYLVESDSGIDNTFGGINAVVNAGRIVKTAGNGTSDLYVNGPLSNTGTIEADSGTLFVDAASVPQISSAALTGGTWNAMDGATLKLPTGTAIASSAANIVLGGSGAAIAGAGGLAANSGSLTLSGGASFAAAGNFTNSGSLTLGPGSTLSVSGNYVQAPAGTLDEQIGGTPASALYGKIAATGTVTLGGGLAVSSTGGFSPVAGQDFPIMTYASASGAFAAMTGLAPFFTAAVNAASLDLVDSATTAVDLAATEVDTTTIGAVGGTIVVNWQVTDSGSQSATGNWQDSVYLSTTSAITGNSILLGAVEHTGGLSAGGTYWGNLITEIPAVPPGSYYVLVQVDSLYQVADPDRDNNTRVADNGALQVSASTLALGAPWPARSPPPARTTTTSLRRRPAGRSRFRSPARHRRARRPCTSAKGRSPRPTPTRRRPTFPDSPARRSPCRRSSAGGRSTSWRRACRGPPPRPLIRSRPRNPPRWRCRSCRPVGPLATEARLSTFKAPTSPPPPPPA